ncbi:MAG: ATP-binding protein [Candidatus Marsarchaeota archaeon]|nr:ATP-binding protein [Candidatus Marsarchaeota archaeon]
MNKKTFMARPEMCAYITLFGWGFQKRQLVAKIKAELERIRMLGISTGVVLDNSPQTRFEDWKTLWRVLAKAVDLPRFDEVDAVGGISIGRGPSKIQLTDQELFKHCAVVGETGSGKSTFVAEIAKEWSGQARHFLVFDWHGEYSKLIRDNSILIIEPDNGLGFDVFAYPQGVDPYIHIDTLMDIFSESFDLSVSQQYVLRSSLRKLYTEKGHGIKMRPERVTISELIKYINEARTFSGWEQEAKLALVRRVSKLGDTGLGGMLNAEHSLGLDEVLNENVLVDLGKIPDHYSKLFVVEAMLRLLYDYKVSRKLALPHMTVVEEARNVVPYRRPEEKPRIAERIIEELRKFGESMIIVTQLPSTVSSEVLTAAGTIFAFRLKGEAEYEILSRRCNLSASFCRQLAMLRTGVCVCRRSDNTVSVIG